jgi:hypothetical protein
VAACVQRVGIVGPKLQRPLRVGQPLSRLAGLEVGPCATVIGPGVVRVDADCARVVGDGAVVIALEPVREAAIAIGEGVPRVDVDGLRAVSDGEVMLALAAVGNAAVVVGYGVLRADSMALVASAMTRSSSPLSK